MARRKDENCLARVAWGASLQGFGGRIRTGLFVHQTVGKKRGRETRDFLTKFGVGTEAGGNVASLEGKMLRAGEKKGPNTCGWEGPGHRYWLSTRVLLAEWVGREDRGGAGTHGTWGGACVLT